MSPLIAPKLKPDQYLQTDKRTKLKVTRETPGNTLFAGSFAISVIVAIIIVIFNINGIQSIDSGQREFDELYKAINKQKSVLDYRELEKIQDEIINNPSYKKSILEVQKTLYNNGGNNSGINSGNNGINGGGTGNGSENYKGINLLIGEEKNKQEVITMETQTSDMIKVFGNEYNSMSFKGNDADWRHFKHSDFVSIPRSVKVSKDYSINYEFKTKHIRIISEYLNFNIDLHSSDDFTNIYNNFKGELKCKPTELCIDNDKASYKVSCNGYDFTISTDGNLILGVKGSDNISINLDFKNKNIKVSSKYKNRSAFVKLKIPDDQTEEADPEQLLGNYFQKLITEDQEDSCRFQSICISKDKANLKYKCGEESYNISSAGDFSLTSASGNAGQILSVNPE